LFDKFFNPKSVAVIGASHKKGKIGNILFKNLLNYKGKVYPINIETNDVLGKKAYKSVLEVKDTIDLAIIAIPKVFVLGALEECGKKKIKDVIVITSGFGEVGDKESEQQLKEVAKKYGIRLLGPNVVGVYNAKTMFDATFLPEDAFKKPKFGKISILSQSGTVTAVLLEKFFNSRLGISKFVSYGNATDINEVDILNYLEKDVNTDVICMYLEEIKNGEGFIKYLKTKKKPLIVLKAGIGNRGKEAIVSHTGSLAGDSKIYEGLFKQFGVIQAEGINDLVNYAKGLLVKPYKEIMILTNGGGYGILLSDWVEKMNLPFHNLGANEIKALKKKINKVGISYKNPFDILGDSNIDTYLTALGAMNKDKEKLYIIVFIGQTDSINEKSLDYFIQKIKKLKINCVFLNTSEEQCNFIEEEGFQCFNTPEELVRGISVMKK